MEFRLSAVPGIKQPRVVFWMPDPPTKDRLTKWCLKLGISRADTIDFHLTIIYSKNGLPRPGLPRPWKAFPVTVASRAMKYAKLGPTRKTLVIELDSDAARVRNKQYMDAGAVSDYPKYRPHLTLSAEGSWAPPVPQELPDFQIVFNREIDWYHPKEVKVDD